MSWVWGRHCYGVDTSSTAGCGRVYLDLKGPVREVRVLKQSREYARDVLCTLYVSHHLSSCWKVPESHKSKVDGTHLMMQTVSADELVTMAKQR